MMPTSRLEKKTDKILRGGEERAFLLSSKEGEAVGWCQLQPLVATHHLPIKTSTSSRWRSATSTTSCALTKIRCVKKQLSSNASPL